MPVCSTSGRRGWGGGGRWQLYQMNTWCAIARCEQSSEICPTVWRSSSTCSLSMVGLRLRVLEWAENETHNALQWAEKNWHIAMRWERHTMYCNEVRKTDIPCTAMHCSEVRKTDMLQWGETDRHTMYWNEMRKTDILCIAVSWEKQTYHILE